MTIMEQRQHTRYRVYWNASIVVLLGGEQKIYHGHIYDISPEGASFYTDLNLHDIKEPIVMLLSIPNGRSNKAWLTIAVRCRMIHTILSAQYNQFHIGFHFLLLKADYRKALDEVLSSRLPLLA